MLRNIDVDLLRSFVTVAELRSFFPRRCRLVPQSVDGQHSDPPA